jgi:hypothetical protein
MLWLMLAAYPLDYNDGSDNDGSDKKNQQRAKANTALAKKKCRAAKLTTLDEIWKNKNLLTPGQWKQPIPAAKWNDFLTWVSEVFAEETSGTAYLLIPDELEPRKNSIFYQTEFPKMKALNKVPEIKRLTFHKSITPKTDSSDVKTWWKKGGADPFSRGDERPCEFKEFCH